MVLGEAVGHDLDLVDEHVPGGDLLHGHDPGEGGLRAEDLGGRGAGGEVVAAAVDHLGVGEVERADLEFEKTAF